MIANQNQNIVQQQGFGIGTYFNSFLIEGYAFTKYREVMIQICECQSLFYFMDILDFLISSSAIIFFYFTDFNAFTAIASILALQSLIYFQQNLSYYKQNKSMIGNIFAFMILNLILSILSQDTFLLVRFSQIEKSQQVDKTEKVIITQKFIYKLVGRFIKKIFFVFVKSVLYNTLIVLHNKVDKEFYFMLAYILLNMIVNIFLQYQYLRLFIFSVKQTAFQKTLTVFEILIEVCHSYCLQAVCIYLLFLMQFVFALMIAVQFISYYFTAFQTVFRFNPMNQSFFALVFMGFKISYLSSLYNLDLFQYEMLLQNKKNQFIFFFANLYIIGIYLQTFYLFESVFPWQLVKLLLILAYFTGAFSTIKLILIIKMIKSCRQYNFSAIEQFQQVKSNSNCRLNINFNSKLKKGDFQKLLSFLDQNLKTQFLSINFENQINIESVNNFYRMNIFDLKSEEISEFFGYFIQKSSFFSVKLQQIDQEEYSIDQIIISKILSCLRQVQIIDQVKFNVKDSDLLLILHKQNIHVNLQNFLRQFNVENIILNLVTFNKYLSFFQKINPSSIVYDLYDI